MNLITRFNINVIIKLHFVYLRQYKQHIQIAQIGFITFNRSVTTNPNVLKIERSTPPTISSAAMFLGIRYTSYDFLCLLAHAPAVLIFEEIKIMLPMTLAYLTTCFFAAELGSTVDWLTARFLSDVACPLNSRIMCIQVCCVVVVVETSWNMLIVEINLFNRCLLDILAASYIMKLKCAFILFVTIEVSENAFVALAVEINMAAIATNHLEDQGEARERQASWVCAFLLGAPWSINVRRIFVCIRNPI